MELLKEVKIYNGKEYVQLVVKFDGGFILPVKPCYDLSLNQYIAYRTNVDKLPIYVNEFNQNKKEGGK